MPSEVSKKHYWFAMFAAFVSMMTLNCDLSLHVVKEEWKLLASEHPIFGVYQHDLETLLQKLTKTTNNEDTIEQLAM